MYLEDTVAFKQNTSKLGVITVRHPLPNPSTTCIDCTLCRGHGMTWKTSLLSTITSLTMGILDLSGPFALPFSC